MCETDCAPAGTGTGIVSITLSALRAARLNETPRKGQLFATDLGRLVVSPPSAALTETTASAMLILSHNITSNQKYFTQPSDSLQLLALDWDEENLPKQVVDAGGFDAILCVSSDTPGTVNPPSDYSAFVPGWQT